MCYVAARTLWPGEEKEEQEEEAEEQVGQSARNGESAGQKHCTARQGRAGPRLDWVKACADDAYDLLEERQAGPRSQYFSCQIFLHRPPCFFLYPSLIHYRTNVCLDPDTVLMHFQPPGGEEEVWKNGRRSPPGRPDVLVDQRFHVGEYHQH